jgi:hypothetical protein
MPSERSQQTREDFTRLSLNCSNSRVTYSRNSNAGGTVRAAQIEMDVHEADLRRSDRGLIAAVVCCGLKLCSTWLL